MAQHDRTVYPLWLRCLGQGLAYLGLLLLPIALLYWSTRQVPLSMQAAAHMVASFFVLPCLYAGVYCLLRRAGTRLQNFIWFVVLFAAGFVWSEWRKAAGGSGWEHWLHLCAGAVYAAGFVVLGLWGWRANCKAARVRTEARGQGPSEPAR